MISGRSGECGQVSSSLVKGEGERVAAGKGPESLYVLMGRGQQGGTVARCRQD